MNEISPVVWADILGHVRTNHPAISRGWFSHLRPGELSSGVLHVFASNVPQLRYLKEHCLRPFVEASQSATGRLVSVCFEATPESADPALLQPAEKLATGDDYLAPPKLNGDNTFENFVVGPCNRMAHASCCAVSQSPGTVYNPVFIHSSSGLGKTHLLQAISHRVLEYSASQRVAYLTCESFVNQYIDATREGTLHRFRSRYRHADMLLIDDVQFLSGRERMQEEFFHTFNTLYEMRRQIVMAADRPPSEIADVEERLVSRFKWGPVVRIDPPCFETRVAILQKKMRMRGEQLPDDVAMHVASVVQSNARELEGALHRLHNVARVAKRSIDLDMAREVLGAEFVAARRQVRIQDIIQQVLSRFDIRLADLQGRGRSKSVVLPRQVCMYLARRLTGYSLGEIGGFFGGRDHTTVLHATRLIKKRHAEDPELRRIIDDIESALARSSLTTKESN